MICHQNNVNESDSRNSALSSCDDIFYLTCAKLVASTVAFIPLHTVCLIIIIYRRFGRYTHTHARTHARTHIRMYNML